MPDLDPWACHKCGRLPDECACSRAAPDPLATIIRQAEEIDRLHAVLAKARRDVVGWRCFHCGFVAMTEAQGLRHYGPLRWGVHWRCGLRRVWLKIRRKYRDG